MKFLLVYIDNYDRSQCIMRFETKDKMKDFIKCDEVRTVCISG